MNTKTQNIHSHLHYIIGILLLSLLFTACSVNKSITGQVTAINDNVVTIDDKTKIKIKGQMPHLGKQTVFMPTVNRKKINAIILSGKR